MRELRDDLVFADERQDLRRIHLARAVQRLHGDAALQHRVTGLEDRARAAFDDHLLHGVARRAQKSLGQMAEDGCWQATALKSQRRFAERDFAVERDRRDGVNCAPIDKSAIGAAEVLKEKAVIGVHREPRVLRGNRNGVGDNFIFAFLADDVAPPAQQAARDQAVVLADDRFKSEVGTGHTGEDVSQYARQRCARRSESCGKP